MRVFALGLALAIAACAPTAAEAPLGGGWRAVVVRAAPVEMGAARVGRLAFRGGLALESEDADFGGLSGLEVGEGGRLIAVTDAGQWFEATLQLDEAGALVGLAEARMAPMRNEEGAVFARKEAADAEGLAHLPDGRLAVSFEQSQSIRIYDLNGAGPDGAAAPGPRLAGAEALGRNSGLEALAADGEGGLIVGAEHGGDGAAPMWRAPLAARGPVAIAARYPLRFGFGMVSLERLADGDFVALERFYAPAVGVRVRVTRLRAGAIDGAGGAVLTEELALLEAPLALDNFEGLASTRAPDGGVRLYLVADNNFSGRQRTLLYAFDVVEAEASAR